VIGQRPGGQIQVTVRPEDDPVGLAVDDRVAAGQVVAQQARRIARPQAPQRPAAIRPRPGGVVQNIRAGTEGQPAR